MECDYIQRNLRYGAIADASHDFFTKSMKALGINENGKWGFDDVHLYIGLDKECKNRKKLLKEERGYGVNEEFSKHGLLYKIFEDSGSQYGIGSKKDDFIKNIKQVLEDNDHTIDITKINQTDDYTIKILHKGGETNTKTLFENNMLTPDDLIEFFDSNYVELLYDTDSIGMLKMMHNTISKNPARFTAYTIINRESLNDNGMGININDDINGIVNIIDIDEEDQLYNKKSFYSKYNIGLDKVLNIYTDEPLKTEHFYIYADGGESFFESTDKKDNTINALCASMWNRRWLLSPDEISARYQAKRSGDWLKALSCLNTARSYIILGDVYEFYNIKECGIIVTIDFILVWYCLLMGIDVILLHTAEQCMIYFKNKNYIRSPIAKSVKKKGTSAKRSSAKRRRFNNTIGGGNKSQELFNLYLKQLEKELDSFEEESSNYNYFEMVALVILSCISTTPRTHDILYYNNLEALFYDIFPSNEGTMSTENEDIIKFFENKFTADCVSFAARQVALHSINKRRGTIYSNGHTYTIPEKAYAKYTEINHTLRDKDFITRKEMIIKKINNIISSAPKLRIPLLGLLYYL